MGQNGQMTFKSNAGRSVDEGLTHFGKFTNKSNVPNLSLPHRDLYYHDNPNGDSEERVNFYMNKMSATTTAKNGTFFSKRGSRIDD